MAQTEFKLSRINKYGKGIYRREGVRASVEFHPSNFTDSKFPETMTIGAPDANFANPGEGKGLNKRAERAIESAKKAQERSAKAQAKADELAKKAGLPFEGQAASAPAGA